MSTPESVRRQLEKLRSDANAATGYEDATLTEAVARLISGYGTGSETACDHAEVNTTYLYNDDGTHTVTNTCVSCGKVVSAQTVSCDMDELVEDNGDGTHTVTNTCSVCGGVLKETAACADSVGDGICDTCGGVIDTTCQHTKTTYSYRWKEAGVHTRTKKCSDCGEVLEQSDVACVDNNADGVCDYCRAEMVCAHSNLKYTYMSENSYATHVKYSICQDCGECVETKYGEACSDADGDGVCDLCGGPMACQHKALLDPTYTDIGYGLHHFVATCQDCGEALDKYVPHEDDGTGVCEKCGAEIPSNYAAGSLNSIDGYRLFVEDGKLKCEKPDASISSAAVAMKGGGGTAISISDKAIVPIPIPWGKKNIVLTAGNSCATSAEIIFIKGTKDAVESYDASLSSVAFNDSVITAGFEANKWDCVVFNIQYSGTSSPVYITQIGTKATLVFE